MYDFRFYLILVSENVSYPGCLNQFWKRVIFTFCSCTTGQPFKWLLFQWAKHKIGRKNLTPTENPDNHLLIFISSKWLNPLVLALLLLSKDYFMCVSICLLCMCVCAHISLVLNSLKLEGAPVNSFVSHHVQCWELNLGPSYKIKHFFFKQLSHLYGRPTAF